MSSAHNARANAEKADHLEPDPGDAGSISPLGDRAVIEIVTAAAETRTLADPRKAGIQLTLHMKTDGGDGVVTATSAVNQTGNNTLTFADVNDNCLLQSIQDGSGTYAWRVVGNDGVALSTV